MRQERPSTQGGQPRDQDGTRPGKDDRLDAAPLIHFFRGPLLPIALTLFLAPLVLALFGILSSFLG